MDADTAVYRLKRLLPIVLLTLVACQDPFGPRTWDATPRTMTLFSASRAEYVGRGSVLDLAAAPVVLTLPIEAPGLAGNWDVALTDEGDGLALVPAGLFEGITSRARIAVLPDIPFDDVREAPPDTASFKEQPTPLRLNAVYVVRTRRAQCGLSSGSRYAKLRPLVIDVAAGIYTFEVVRNPFCDNRSFVPPGD